MEEQYLPGSYAEHNNLFFQGEKRTFSLLEGINPENNYYFYITYSSKDAFSLVINKRNYFCPSSSQILTLSIPLPQSEKLHSFTIIPGEGPNGINIEESGVLIFNGINDVFSRNFLKFSADGSLELTLKDHLANTGFSIILESDLNSHNFNSSININETEIYDLKTRKGRNSYWFYNLPENDIHHISLDLKQARLVGLDRDVQYKKEEAINIDLEQFAFYDLNDWRQDNYELFRWDLFPDMLLIDTLSYEVQSAFFKRLAFFTEKKISAGTLLSEEELELIHGWNAHDYKADDLARFYNEAQASDFPLNEYELLLKEILLENGILRKSGNRVRPLKGGILSISRSSSDRLRWLFLTHECYHGVFFSSDEFIEEITSIWEGLAEVEREFWRIFLDMYGYNINDEYLLINEFQAYLMQQDVSLADAYFRGKIQWILSIKPNLRKTMNVLLSEYGDSFIRSAREVEKAAYSLTGIRAGDLVLKRKK